MALKSGQPQGQSIEELLESVEQNLDRLRVMYEQYFLGIQKQAPGPLHSDVERRIRDLVQANLRNTATRYRFATMQQKFSSYNAYWRRTLRQIENGTYVRSLSRLGRQAARSGAEVPEEILAAMPKFMRDQVMRDRAAAVATAKRKGKVGDEAAAGAGAGAAPPTDDELLDLGEAFVTEQPPLELPPDELADVVAMIKEPSELRRNIKQHRGPHRLDEADADIDLDSFFAAVEAEDVPPPRAARDSNVSFRQVTRSTASPPLAQQTSPAPRPSQQMAAIDPRALAQQTSPAPRPPAAADPLILAQQTSPAPRPAPPGPPGFGVRGPVQTQPGVAASPMPPQAQAQAPQRPSQRVPAQPPAPAQSIAPPTRATPMPPLTRPTTMGGPPPPQMAIPAIRAPGAPPPQAAPPAAAAAPPIASSPPPAAARPQVTAPPRRVARAQTEQDPPRPAPPPARPPAGMTDADVNALYAKYVKAKEMVGEAAGPGSYGKLLKTIHAQAPKIMEQYKAKGVDFQVVVKDNQVIIRAKPKP